MTSKDTAPGTFIRIALIDADGRVLLCGDRREGDRHEAVWDFPGTRCKARDPLQDVVAHLQDRLRVTTFVKALFPLTFSLVEDADGQADITVLYGCRNWVGANGLQHIRNDHAEIVWIKPVRMGDYALTPGCHMMMTSLMTLLS